jgi:para-aminobenzoate synthetase component 1
LLSASPERFLKKSLNKLYSQPIKGTVRRAKDKDADEALKTALLNSEKERAENLMIVDLVRNDLAKSSEVGSVAVDELFGIYSFKQVHQMISTVSSTIIDGINPVEAIENAFPMGSMTGAPKVMAMKLIEQYETTKRGLYSGAVGYFAPNEDFDFNVVIRSIQYNAATQYVSFEVGSAITFDSDAEQEYEECLLKASAMLQALGNYE